MSNEVIVRLRQDTIRIKGGEYVRDLVRCRECKYFRSHNESPDTCGAYNGMVSPKADDYCSMGERKDQ